MKNNGNLTSQVLRFTRQYILKKTGLWWSDLLSLNCYIVRHMRHVKDPLLRIVSTSFYSESPYFSFLIRPYVVSMWFWNEVVRVEHETRNKWILERKPSNNTINLLVRILSNLFERISHKSPYVKKFFVSHLFTTQFTQKNDVLKSPGIRSHVVRKGSSSLSYTTELKVLVTMKRGLVERTPEYKAFCKSLDVG